MDNVRSQHTHTVDGKWRMCAGHFTLVLQTTRVMIIMLSERFLFLFVGFRSQKCTFSLSERNKLYFLSSGGTVQGEGETLK